MKTALVIMAAGIGSRFGGGIKQLEPVGMNGEIIMDFSIHDAIEAGFHKIVFLIRHDLEDVFKEVIGNRIEKTCSALGVEVAYAFQEKEDVPAGVTIPEERKKPWGTGQAVLACKNVLDCPFVVINADDYYGKEGFKKVHDYLTASNDPSEYCMAGFIIKNTLSDNGAVTRGIAKMDANNMLTDVLETSNIIKVPGADGGSGLGYGVEADGVKIDPESLVSMNMWGLKPEILALLEQGFVDFFNNTPADKLVKAEYLLPMFIDELIKGGKATVKVLSTGDKWFGVTYKEDKPVVVESIRKLIADGIYKADLFSDL
ncbi:MAG: sugar phosphate nucleotidyltransferase [Eubacteriales bacterium]|nr:sugar phosphate nucleotidyltransferase [Eubacteriales bacterium]